MPTNSPSHLPLLSSGWFFRSLVMNQSGIICYSGGSRDLQ